MIEIKFQTDNDVFANNYSKAVEHVLIQVQNEANKIGERRMKLPMTIILWDGNGNSIGTAKFTNK
jgi:hypothetical protein